MLVDILRQRAKKQPEQKAYIFLKDGETDELSLIYQELERQARAIANSRQSRHRQGEIAIIGMACRFPGANNYQQFWENLEQGINSISEIPSERWEVEKYYSPNPEERNKSISKWGGFIEGIDQFDAKFFGISPREAQRMDPQQRLMLELSWSCLEDSASILLG